MTAHGSLRTISDAAVFPEADVSSDPSLPKAGLATGGWPIIGSARMEGVRVSGEGRAAAAFGTGTPGSLAGKGGKRKVHRRPLNGRFERQQTCGLPSAEYQVAARENGDYRALE
jgi:hypothetical protein